MGVLVPVVTLLALHAEPLAVRAAGDSAAYWQQDVRYVIQALLDEPSGVLVGGSDLTYHNNSPDTLTEIFFHLELNAFRPGSKWVEAELREGIRRFADLPEPFYAYQRLDAVSVDGVPIAAEYPGAPDSTIVRFRLPTPVAPGDSIAVAMTWRARLSAIPRRQGRLGRRFDFAYWYPKVCVFDRYGWQAHPLSLVGESYGEFGSYDVMLEVPEDQVLAATGVVAEGDPGWQRARATPATPVTALGERYVPHPAPTGATAGAAPGRKRVRFRAERVHHFAWSANPDYVYEEGRFGPAVIRVLYVPEDRATWGGGRVLARAVRAMAWLDTIFGSYAWPQATIVHRIEGGGTEFPMMVMLGGSGESLVFHELGHLYTYGILANNEWKEGWLDEGFTTFQTAWNFQRRGMGVPSRSTQALVLGYDLDGWSEPVSTPADRMAEVATANRMIYTKGQLILEMLRYVVGEETFRRALREYYRRWQFRHVSEEALRQVFEEASGQDLGWFFGQWLHATPLVDYRLGAVERRREAGGWSTRIAVERLGEGRMPVDVALPQRDTTLVVRAQGVARREVIEVRTTERPGRIELDPARRTMDWNYLNNRERTAAERLHLWPLARAEHRLGWTDTVPARRDARVINWLPLAWYNEAGGITIGLQARQNYLGRFERHAVQLTFGLENGYPSTIDLGSTAATLPDVHFSVRNPTWLHAPRRQVALELWKLEGRVGGRLAATWDRSAHRSFGPRVSVGLDLLVMGVERMAYLDTARWDDANTAELTASVARTDRRPAGAVSHRATATVGAVWSSPRPGRRGSRTVDVAPVLRGEVERRGFWTLGPFEVRRRVYLAAVAAGTAVPRQRQIFVAGADPYATLANPLLRSRGALLVGDDVHYHAPGGASVRGLSPAVTSRLVLAANMELALPVLRRPSRRLANAVSVAAFFDAALADSATVSGASLTSGLSAAGFGLRVHHRVGPTGFVTRLDVPLRVSTPGAAVGARAGDGRFRFRWVVSLEEAL